MNFREKLQKLRKERGYSQEDLADVIGVSRQAVSKWESGTSYPETEKLIELSKLFSISLDEFLKEEKKEEKPVIDPIIEKQFLTFYKKFSIMISLGVFLCIMGLVATAFMEDIFKSDIPQIITLFSFFLVAVILFVYYGIEYSRYEKVEKLYKQKIKDKDLLTNTSKKFSLMMTLGVALCILGIVFGGVAGELTNANGFQALAFFGPISIALWIFIYCGMEHALYHPEAEKKNEPDTRIHGAIMLTATLIFILIGLLTNAWHPAWVVFPVGGILCAIVSVLTNEK
ncbi:MAG: helix-turn-helix transcriptional regulator [Bacilli bacterium]|nr:helix-turn-helix transcriptional regulator [Bacilli bacterium]